MKDVKNEVFSEKRKRTILSFLFSSVGIIFLMVLAEVVLLFIAFGKLYNYLLPLFGVLTIINIITISIMLSDENVNFEMKATWTIIIFIMPLVGCVIYFFVNLDFLNNAYKKQVFSIERDTIENMSLDTSTLDEIKSIPELAQLHNYLSSSGNVGVYKNSYLKYFESGEAAFPQMLQELKSAKKSIYMEYFIIDEGYMWSSILDILLQKVSEGVDVRILYDATCDFAKVPTNFYKNMQKLKIRCHKFAPLLPIVSPYYNYRDHRKLMIIDGISCFTGGINIADEYINKIDIYGYWKDTVILIKGEAVKSYTLMFLQLFSLYEKDIDYQQINQQYPVYQQKGYVIPYGDVPFDQYSVGKYVYMNILNNAKDYVYIMTPYFIIDSELTNTIINTALRGVDVRIILPGVPDKRIVKEFACSRYKQLIDNKVKIYEFSEGFVHAKMMISDDIKAVVGTINMDYRSLYHHYENAVYMYDCDEISAIKNDFQLTLDKSRLIGKDYKQKFFYAILVKVIKFLEPLV